MLKAGRLPRVSLNMYKAASMNPEPPIPIAAVTVCHAREASAITGGEAVSVSANIEGLAPNTTYHFRLVAGDADGSNTKALDETFTTPSRPLTGDESFSEVGVTSATVRAEVNTVGFPTTYQFEYGTSTAYGSKTLQASLGGAPGAIDVVAEFSGLQPDTAYHFRVVATNAQGTRDGSDSMFTTYPTSVFTLPDDRVVEMVTTPEGQDANVYVPDAVLGSNGDATTTELPFQAAADGNVVVYLGASTSSGNGNEGGGGGNEYLATRSPTGGWTQVDIQPSGYRSPVYRGFSSDLSLGILGSSEPLSANAPAGGYEVLYSRSTADGSANALFTTTPVGRSAEEFGTVNPEGVTQ